MQRPVRLVLACAIVLAVPVLRGSIPVARAATKPNGFARVMMSDAMMRQMSAAWFAAHPITPSSPAAATGAFADTFTAAGFSFDHDGVTGNIDTVFIHENDIVLWLWHDNSHTVTSGNGSGDTSPPAGSLFNAPLDAAHTQFAFTFPTEGTYPFFCVFHQSVGVGMKGVVVVAKSLVGVPGERAVTTGFVRDPAPVPSRGAIAFRFALVSAGRARGEVYDVRGRRVALAFDRETGAGVFDGAWDGRVSGGRRAASGVYFLRLTLPGVTATRRVVLTD